MTKGKLYIIPVPISEDTFHNVIPDFNNAVVGDLRHFVVEKLKTARQFLRKMDASFPIDDSVFFEQDKHAAYDFHPDVVRLLKEGQSIGLMSESGYPGVADPGTKIVALAHENECEVIPLVGPSSILLALSASGMNGQGFTFHGYLPKSGNERVQKIKDLVSQIQKNNFAQLFIETPYRNDVMFDDLLKVIPETIKLTVAYDVTGSAQKITTRRVAEWKKLPFKFEKLPCVFIIGN